MLEAVRVVLCRVAVAARRVALTESGDELLELQKEAIVLVHRGGSRARVIVEHVTFGIEHVPVLADVDVSRWEVAGRAPKGGARKRVSGCVVLQGSECVLSPPLANDTRRCACASPRDLGSLWQAWEFGALCVWKNEHACAS